MYRVSYRDAGGTARLVAVAATLDEAHAVLTQIEAVLPDAVERMVIAEDPLAGSVFRVVQPPDSLDAAMGMPVLYLGGTICPQRNWQAEAIRELHAELVVIANPRREHPATGEDDLLVQIAWQQRHLFRAEFILFWLQGNHAEPVSMIELGDLLGSPTPMAVGVSPDYPWRTQVRAMVGHMLPQHPVHDSLTDTISAAVTLVRDRPRREFRLPAHDAGPAASMLNMHVAIARVENGPGLVMRLNELVLEAGCAAGHGIDPGLLTKIYMGVDRLRLDATDPLGWTELMDAGHALTDNY
jgi:hypothetical protein